MFSINRHGKHLATTARKSRRARVLTASAIAGILAAGAVGVAVPANASTIINPNCPVPTSVAFTKIGATRIQAPEQRRLFVTYWQTTYNGQHYVGDTGSYVSAAAANVAPNLTLAGSCSVG